MRLDTLELRGFAAGGEIEVPCDRIDTALDDLWRAMARKLAQGAAAPGSGSVGATARAAARLESVHRACLLNLVVHAGDSTSEVVARFLASSLTDRFPARILLVRARPEEPGEGPPHAFVAASRTPEAEGHAAQVAGELVILDARGAQLDRVPPVVRAALEPDLATTLWWTGAVPPRRPYVAALRDVADRVIVDSETIPDDSDVAHLFPPTGDCRLADLAWPRLAPWRIAIARAFDPPGNRAFLREVDAVRVVLGAPGGKIPDASAAPLLAGWLATALRWRPCVRGAATARSGERSVTFSCDDGGRAASFAIEPRRSAPPGVAEVTLAAGDARFVFRRSPQGLVEVSTPPGLAPVRPAPLRELDAEEVLAATLLATREDPIAPESIRRAAEIGAALFGG